MKLVLKEYRDCAINYEFLNMRILEGTAFQDGGRLENFLPLSLNQSNFNLYFTYFT